MADDLAITRGLIDGNIGFGRPHPAPEISSLPGASVPIFNSKGSFALTLNSSESGLGKAIVVRVPAGASYAPPGLIGNTYLLDCGIVQTGHSLCSSARLVADSIVIRGASASIAAAAAATADVRNKKLYAGAAIAAAAQTAAASGRVTYGAAAIAANSKVRGTLMPP